MVFKFESKTDAEIAAMKNNHLLPDGNYEFTVRSAVEQISKSNNPMLKVTLAIKSQKGNTHNIDDYLLSSGTMIYKLKHFCEAIGLIKEYEANEFDVAHCLNKSGHLELTTQAGKPRPDGNGTYPDRNSVKDYVAASNTKTPSASEAQPFQDDTDIPF